MLRTKRSFYVPGLINLIGLFVALPFFYKKNNPVKEYGLPLFVPNDNNDKSSSYMFSKYNLEKDILKKKKIKFNLDEDSEENKKKIEMIKYEALKLKYTEDTSTVILINFTDSVSYGEFVSIVDMCHADDHKRFAPWDNKFVIFGEWPKVLPNELKKNEPMLYCGTIAATKHTYYKKEDKLILTRQARNKIRILATGGILLLIFSIFKIRKQIVSHPSSAL